MCGGTGPAVCTGTDLDEITLSVWSVNSTSNTPLTKLADLGGKAAVGPTANLALYAIPGTFSYRLEPATKYAVIFKISGNKSMSWCALTCLPGVPPVCPAATNASAPAHAAAASCSPAAAATCAPPAAAAHRRGLQGPKRCHLHGNNHGLVAHRPNKSNK